MVIQFGYATMFISAYPLATSFALVNNYVMMRVSAWKLCQLCRRPEPRSAEDIGTWLDILEIVSYAAVFVSAGLVAFTGSLAINRSWPVRVWIFIGMSAGIILVKLLVSVMLPDTSEEVVIQLARSDYIKDKLYDNMPDEDDSKLSTDVDVKIQFTIRITDDDPL